MEGSVTRVIPWMRALPDRVALGSFSTELGDVNMCLYALEKSVSTGIGYKSSDTHRDEKRAPEKTIPRIFGIIYISVIKKYRPLVSGYDYFTAAQPFLNPARREKPNQKLMKALTQNLTNPS